MYFSFLLIINEDSCNVEKCIERNNVNLFLWTFYNFNESVEHVARAKYFMSPTK